MAVDGDLPPLTYPDASFSPQTFIFTDSPDELLQERLGNCLAGDVGVCDKTLGSLELDLLSLALGTEYFVPRNRVSV